MKTKNLLFAAMAAGILVGCKQREEPAKKPVIYLYPEKKQEVTVKLDFKGKLRATYPLYKDQWTFIADTDGTLTDPGTGEQYGYLFYDGIPDTKPNAFTEGFSVKTDTVVSFLKHQLTYLGLTSREYNDMISFWLPELNEKPFNLIRFRVNKNFDAVSTLDIQPKPNTEIRVMMEFIPMDDYMALPGQVLPKGIRKGFTVVEWGGIHLDASSAL